MANVINGTAAAEFLSGSDENDIIYTNGGADWVWGFAGNDTLVQNVGSATALLGGKGNDIYVVFTGTIAISEAYGSGIDTLRTYVTMTADLADGVENIENIFYGGALTLRGNSLDNRIICGSASDTAYGRGGNDFIVGSQYNPGLLYGEGGNDRLFGGNRPEFGDILDGGLNNDFLEGRLGPDDLTGGAGKDIFHYRGAADSKIGAGADVIADFDDVGNDRIDLRDVFGGTLVYRGTKAFTAAGQVRVAVDGVDVVVQVNTGGSLAADMHIRLTDTTLASMAANDFFL